MKYLHSFVVLAAVGLLAGCSAATEATEASEADVTSSPGLTMSGGWQLSNLPAGQSVEDFAVSRELPDTRPASIYVVSRRTEYAPETYTNDLLVSRSDDGGSTFQTISLIPNAPSGARIFVAPSAGRNIYVTAGGSSTGMSPHDAPGMIWRSTDGGVHFSESPAFDAPVDLDINPENPFHLVGANCKGVLRSMDGGVSFERIPNSPDLGGMCNTATLIRGKNDRNTMHVLYSVGEGGGSLVYRTTNGAGTWEEVTGGFAMSGFEVHPNDANHVYVFDAERGWLSSADGGKQWFPHNATLEGAQDHGYWDTNLSNVAFDTFTGPEPTLYIVNQTAVKRWVPMNAPEGGKFVNALAPAPTNLDRVRFEVLSASLMDGTPSPALIGITGWNENKPRRLAIANVKVPR